MNATELAAALRNFADRLESKADELGDVRLKAQIYVNGIDDRSMLKSVVSLMDNPQAQSRKGTHWVRSGGAGDDFQVSAFYTAGLLGPTVTKEIKVVKKERSSDLAGLLAE